MIFPIGQTDISTDTDIISVVLYTKPRIHIPVSPLIDRAKNVVNTKIYPTLKNKTIYDMIDPEHFASSTIFQLHE